MAAQNDALAKHYAAIVNPSSTAERLYLAHVEKADQMARRLCWHFKVSGAMEYEDEARSVARIALWDCARKFDPNKQKWQCMERERQNAERMTAIMLGYPEPVFAEKDPFANFWIRSIIRVRGAVIDLFRAERLITKPPKGQTAETMTPTMLHYERFLSMDRMLSDAGVGSGGGNHDTFGDMIPSSDRADKNDELSDMRKQISGMKDAACLNEQERTALELFYGYAGFTKSEVAAKMGVTNANVTKLLASAIDKMRATQIRPA